MILSRLPFCRPLPATLNHFPDKRDSRVETGERIGKVRQRGRAFLFFSFFYSLVSGFAALSVRKRDD
jgi:hypothetical protein